MAKRKSTKVKPPPGPSKHEKAKKERLRRYLGATIGASLGAVIGIAVAEDPEKASTSLGSFLETVSINGVPFAQAVREAAQATTNAPVGAPVPVEAEAPPFQKSGKRTKAKKAAIQRPPPRSQRA